MLVQGVYWQPDSSKITSFYQGNQGEKFLDTYRPTYYLTSVCGFETFDENDFVLN